MNNNIIRLAEHIRKSSPKDKSEIHALIEMLEELIKEVEASDFKNLKASNLKKFHFNKKINENITALSRCSKVYNKGVDEEKILKIKKEVLNDLERYFLI